MSKNKKEGSSAEKECVEIFPANQDGPIHTIKKNAQGFREDVFNTLDVERGGLLKHRIVIGDICAIDVSSSNNITSSIIQGKKQKYPPFVDKKWIVGQVLTLSKVRESLTKTSWCATIRWMARFDNASKEATGYIQSDEELKSFIKGSSGKPAVQFRPNHQALLETNTVLVGVPVADILPADLCIRHSTDFLNVNQLDHEHVTILDKEDDSNTMLDTIIPAYKAFFHCVARCTESVVPNNNNAADASTNSASSTTLTRRQLHDVREEWAKYREQHFSNNSSAAAPPPPPLQRGWDLLTSAHDDDSSPELQQALRRAYTKRSRDDVFSAAGTTTAAASADAAAGVTSSSSVSKQQQRGNDRALSTKTNSKISSRGGGKKKSTTATASSSKKKAPSATREPSTKKNNRDLAGKRKPSAKSSAAPTTQKKTKKSRSSDTTFDDESDSATSDDDADSQEVVVLNPLPIGSVVHELQMPVATTLKTKKKNGKTAAPRITTTRFVQGIELNVDLEALHGDLRREMSTSDARWSFGVGDVIALRCEGARKPIRGPVPTKSVWYPFTVPWYPVQVVAIYSKDKDDQVGDSDDDDCPYRMQVRWLTRFAELPATAKKKLPPEDKKMLQGDKAAYMVIEDDSEAQEVSVEAALGNAVMTSKTKPPSTWLKAFLSKKSGKQKTRLPQVPLICCFQCGKDGASLERIEDWTNYHESVGEGPMARGLALGMPGQHHRLRQEYEAGILGGSDKSAVSTKATKSQKRKSTASSSSRKRSKKEESRQDESHSSDCDMDLSDTVSSVPTVLDRRTTPFGDVVYVMPAKGKKEPIHFVEGVEMDVDPLAFHPDVRSAGATGTSRRWRLRVGDLVALRDDSSKTNQGLSRGKSNKQKWYPFVKPWSAAQVLAIYHRGGSSSTTGYQMEVRWFSRPEELQTSVTEHLTRTAKQELLQSENAAHMVVELDEVVEEKRVETALGHVVTTSELTPPSSWLQNFLSRKRLPQVPLICRYLQNTKDDDPILDRVDDWTNYGHSLVGPLSRGLLCPKAMPGTDKTLRKRYELCVCHQYELTDQTLQEFAPDEPEATSLSPKDANDVQWTQSQMDSASIKIDEDNFLDHSTKGRFGKKYNFLHSIVVPVVRNRCDARATSKKSSTTCFTVEIGDIVCLANNKAGIPTGGTSKKPTAWFPFVGPWGYCQVLSIYQISGGVPLLEIRRFLRKTELPEHVQSWMPPKSDKDREEVYESDEVERDIPASQVLGLVSIFFAHHSKSIASRSKDKTRDSVATDAPQVSCRCRFFYLSSFQRIQPLFCSDPDPSDPDPSKWFYQLMERGFKLSEPVTDDDLLRSSIEFCRGIHIDAIDDTARDFLRGMMDSVEDELPAPKEVVSKELENGCQRSYFFSAAARPNWAAYVQPDIVCSESDRAGQSWTVRVGDVVALHTPNSNGRAMYPFSVPWKPCQVLSIYRDATGDGEDPKEMCLSLEVRWLSFGGKSDLINMPRGAVGLESIHETNDGDDCTGPLDTSMLLGPLSLHCQALASKMWDGVVPFLPLCPLSYSGDPEDCNNPRLLREKLQTLVIRGISSHYSDEDKELVLQALKQDVQHKTDNYGVQPIQRYALNALRSESDVASLSSFKSTSRSTAGSSESTSRSSNRVCASKPPFHIDKASGTSYFSELTIAAGDDSWTVRLGDPVVVKHKMCTGRAKFGSMSGNTKRDNNWPFETPWALGEVVMIAERSKSLTDKSAQDDCGFDVEVRWFYRSSEIPGSVETEDATSCEEIFESDHYDTVSASSLLAPFVLHEHPRDIPEEQRYLGMPVVNFVCRRFWSCHRKSLVPCAGLGSRISRGRLQSILIGKDTALAAAVEKIGDNATRREEIQTTSRAPPNWRTAFAQVIHKLSLTDASKVALEDASALVGREKEKTEIMSFLRTAITGKGEQGTKEDKASIFIAGAPGVGKTACVRAVVRELKEQQSEGLIPRFDFISLNGMEMRHPFEAYAQLWEKLHVGDKVQCTPELAVKKLETYFAGQTFSTATEEKVVVLLLDEIDYLLTKTQSVLYHFFDWPRRAVHNRLIVIGVSNTVNLPERLQSKVQSRIGSCRCSFKAYNSKEIAAILESKMEQASPRQKVFDNDAILFVSKKTASMSGDIRKAFNICRSAAELVMSEATSDSQQTCATEGPVVRIKDVSKVSRESFNSAQSHAVSMCTSFEVLLLVSLASLSKTTGREVGGFDMEELLVKMESIANSSGDRQYLPAPSLSETLYILSRLGEAQLVSMVTPQATSIGYRSCIAGSGGPWPVVSLIIDSVQLLLALKATPHHLLGDKYLAM